MAAGAEPAATPPLRFEIATLTRLAGPIVLANLSQMGMGAADTIMAGRVSAAELAGVALGGNVYYPALLFISGTILALTPTIAQLNGAGRSSEAGEVTRQAFWMALFGGILLIFYLHNAAAILRLLGVDPEAIPIADRYLTAISFGVVQVLCYFVLRYFCEGMSWTRPAMVLGIAGLLLKVPLNYLLIHGNDRLGIPALGGPGCGWSTATIVSLQCLTLLLIVARSHLRGTGLLDRFSTPDLRAISKLARLGLPIGVTNSLEVALFSGTTLLVGTLGVTAVASHQIAMNIGGLAFMIPSAMGMAAAIRVGHNVGRRDYPGARQSGWSALLVALAFSAVAIAVMLMFGEFITGLYSTDAAVVKTAAFLLLFVAGFQVFDAGQVACMGSLRGYKDTRTPMLIALFAYWLIGFPMAGALGLGWFGIPALGLSGFWIGLIGGLAIASVLLLFRFRALSNNPLSIAGLATH
ncbi:MAG: MATE family efflux transporter [Pseudomonadota bacterium]